MKSIDDLEDFKINIKFRISGLWTAVMFCYLYGDYFSFYVPGQIEGFINEQTLLNDPLILFTASILMVIPSLMVFLTLILKPKLNRTLNIIFGIIYSAIMILIAIKSISLWWTFYVFLAMVEILITSSIVWLAWKWPRIETLP